MTVKLNKMDCDFGRALDIAAVYSQGLFFESLLAVVLLYFWGGGYFYKLITCDSKVCVHLLRWQIFKIKLPNVTARLRTVWVSKSKVQFNVFLYSMML